VCQGRLGCRPPPPDLIRPSPRRDDDGDDDVYDVLISMMMMMMTMRSRPASGSRPAFFISRPSPIPVTPPSRPPAQGFDADGNYYPHKVASPRAARRRTVTPPATSPAPCHGAMSAGPASFPADPSRPPRIRFAPRAPLADPAGTGPRGPGSLSARFRMDAERGRLCRGGRGRGKSGGRGGLVSWAQGGNIK
jgi:hypothetical protein